MTWEVGRLPTFFIARFPVIYRIWNRAVSLERLPDLETRVAPTLESMGYEVVRIAVTGSDGRRTLQVMADRADGSQISVDDCEAISHALSAIFDVEDPVNGRYDLEVSSAGIDRPLTRPKDFKTYAGFLAKIDTKAPVNTRKRFRGRLEGLTEDGHVRITMDNVETVIALTNINAAKLVLTDELIAATATRAAENNG
jgi:ribosome maturation factor RimP